MHSAEMDDDNDDLLSMASLASIHRERISFSSSLSDLDAEDYLRVAPEYGTVSSAILDQDLLNSAESGLSRASSTSSQSVFMCRSHGPDLLAKQQNDFKLNLSDDDESIYDEEPLHLDYQDVEDVGSEMSICL